MEEAVKPVRLSNGLAFPPIGLGPGIMGYKPGQPTDARQKPVARWNIPLRAYNKFIVRPQARRAKAVARAEYINSVANGFRAGFRLLDYSASYGSGDTIVSAIEKAGLHREAVFLTGRISNRAQEKGADAVRCQIGDILTQYSTSYVDLLMFHWPVPRCFEETWRVICEAYDKGLARSIGVANCHPHHLLRLEKAGLRPMVNQFEVHPLFTQKELVKFNQDRGIVVEAYTPIARYDDRLMRLPKLRAIAANHGKSPVQTILRWHIQNGCVPIIRSMNASRQKEDFDVFDFKLSQDEMAVIDSFNINSRLRFDPDNCDFSIL